MTEEKPQPRIPHEWRHAQIGPLLTHVIEVEIGTLTENAARPRIRTWVTVIHPNPANVIICKITEEDKFWIDAEYLNKAWTKAPPELIAVVEKAMGRMEGNGKAPLVQQAGTIPPGLKPPPGFSRGGLILP